MARYIDTEIAKKFIQQEAKKIPLLTNEPEHIVSRTYLLAIKHVIEDMDYVPAADVAEVKHGEWIYHECVSSYDGAISGYSCSECCIFVDEEIFDADELHKDFCGHCGAKMDGERKENDGTHRTRND